MLFSDIGILDKDFCLRENYFVGVKEGKIAYVGQEKPKEDFGETYDGRGKILMSGLVNSHSHAPMTLLRGYAENLPLDRWLNNRVFPFEDRISGEDPYYSTLLAIAEMLESGTTSFTDMYFFSESVAKAVGESGIKCNFSRAITSFQDCDIHTIESFKESEAIIRDFHGAFDGRLKIDMSLHAEYTNRRTIIEQFSEIVKAHGLRAHIHLSETKKETEECKQRHGGLTPTALFETCGLFQVPVTAAHCVWLSDDDMEILKNAGATVATCPASNLKLGSGVCNVAKLLERGVRVAIGTDSVASNNKLDMFREMYLCALLPKGTTYRADAVSDRDVLKMATVNGYLAQGRADCGSIEAGNRADLIVVRTDSVHMCPHTDTVNNLVYAADGRDVALTMVDGNVLYKDGEFKTIDIEKVRYEVEKRSRRIINEVTNHA